MLLILRDLLKHIGQTKILDLPVKTKFKLKLTTNWGRPIYAKIFLHQS